MQQTGFTALLFGETDARFSPTLIIFKKLRTCCTEENAGTLPSPVLPNA